MRVGLDPTASVKKGSWAFSLGQSLVFLSFQNSSWVIWNLTGDRANGVV